MSNVKSRMILKIDPILKEFEYNGHKFEFYERGWWSRIHEYKWLVDVAKEYFKDGIRFKSGLDVATGIQHPGMFLLKDAGFNRVVGFDLFDTKDFHFPHLLGDGIAYVKGDVLTFSSPEKFDFLSCISFLEHLPSKYQEKALINILSVLNESSCVAFTFDMPGYDYKTDLALYKRILSASGFSFEEEKYSEDEILTTQNSPIAAKELKKMNLSCYRLFAWR